MVESGVMDTGCQVLNQPRSDFQHVGDTLCPYGSRFILTSAHREICPSLYLCQEGLTQVSLLSSLARWYLQRQTRPRQSSPAGHTHSAALQELPLCKLCIWQLTARKLSFHTMLGVQKLCRQETVVNYTNMMPDGLNSDPASPLTGSELLHNLMSLHLFMHVVEKLMGPISELACT